MKERWGENANGQKHGKYIQYTHTGEVLENATYVNGKKQGSGFYHAEPSTSFRSMAVDPLPILKISGTYTNDKPTGVWTVYNRYAEGVEEKRLYSDTGALLKKSLYKKGKIVATYSIQNDRAHGLARIYGATEAEYASGSFANDVPIGTWQNAALLPGVNKQPITYSKGNQLVFENGVAVTSINATGVARSLKAEAQQQQQREQARRDSLAVDERLAMPVDTEPFTKWFNPKSYQLTDAGMVALQRIANQLQEREGTRYHVKRIVISTHAPALTGSNADAATLAKRDTSDYILTLNRSYSVRAYLSKVLHDKSINFLSYPCGSKLSLMNSDQKQGRSVDFDNEDRMQITFDEILPNARKVYNSLSEKYSLSVKNEIVPNDRMKVDIITDMVTLFKDDVYRSKLEDRQRRIARGEKSGEDFDRVAGLVPVEFWVSNLTNGMPKDYTQKEEPEQFKKVFIDVLNQLNKKFNTTIEPTTFFTSELLLAMNK